MRRFAAWVGVLLGGAGVGAAIVATRPGPPPPAVAPPRTRPITFDENRGQWEPGVRFASRTPVGTVRLTDEGITLERPGIAIRLDGARRVEPAGRDRLGSTAGYFLGSDPSRWAAGVARYGAVEYPEVRPGVTLRLHGTGGELEYDVLLAPGVDPASVVFTFPGADALSLDARGDVRLRAGGQELIQKRPRVFQPRAGAEEELASRYVQVGTGGVRLEVDHVSRDRPLRVDPVLVYATYLGGGDDYANAAAVDATGNVWVVGTTSSSSFPTTPNALFGGARGFYDVFVSKFSPDGSLLFSTYLGGTDYDDGRAVALDAAGNAYVAGITGSTDFPTQSAFQPALGAGSTFDGCALDGGFGPKTYNGFVTEIAASGASLVYSTYLGGGADDEAQGLTVDGAGRAYVTGYATSTDFPTTAGGLQTFGGCLDVFLARLDHVNGKVQLGYSTFLGGSGWDLGHAVALDSSGSAYLAGSTWSPNSDFPLAPSGSALQQSFRGGYYDAFAAKVAFAGDGGGSLVYSTYLGGVGWDEAFGVAVDPAGRAWFGGYTDSSDFPTTLGSFQTQRDGGFDAFLLQLSPSGTALDYATFFGGRGFDRIWALALDDAGAPVVAGTTTSDNFPLRQPLQSLRGTGTGCPDGGCTDAFVARLPGGVPTFSTYLGGSGSDYAYGMALRSDGPVVVGQTFSRNFPATLNAVQGSLRGSGSSNAFIAYISYGVDAGADAGPSDAGRPDAGPDDAGVTPPDGGSTDYSGANGWGCAAGGPPAAAAAAVALLAGLLARRRRRA